MKQLIILFSLSILIFSCGNEKDSEEVKIETEKTEEVKIDPVKEASDLKELQNLDEQLVKNDLTIDLHVANELYTRAIAFSKEHPKSESLEPVLGFAYKGAEDLGNFSEAVEILHRLANDFPESNRTAVYMYNKGKVLEEKMDKKDAAKAAYQELIKRFPKNPLSKSMKSYLKNGLIDMTKEEKIKFLQEQNQEEEE